MLRRATVKGDLSILGVHGKVRTVFDTNMDGDLLEVSFEQPDIDLVILNYTPCGQVYYEYAYTY